LVGKWKVTELSTNSGSWPQSDATLKLVEFLPNGSVISSGYVIQGSYCQYLTAYAYRPQNLEFDFDKQAICIPIVDPGPSISTGKVLEITPTSLVIQWGHFTIRHTRL
jgi:hypothetical protein